MLASSFSRRGIGLLGGTFDPVHWGHIAVARGAWEQLRLDHVDLMPAPAPWQKNVLTSIEARVQLLEAAVEPYPWLRINLTEALREGPTYTIDTLKALREHVGPSVPLVLILGADQWRNFHTWREWSSFLHYAHIALCNRENTLPITQNPEVRAWSQDRFVPAIHLTEHAFGSITTYQIPAHSASSTKIRALLSQPNRYEAFRQLQYWLPSRVSRLISRLHLY